MSLAIPRILPRLWTLALLVLLSGCLAQSKPATLHSLQPPVQLPLSSRPLPLPGLVLLMLPEFFFALFEKNGMHLETILTNFINVRFKRPAVRCYEIENLYEYEPEKPVTPKAKKGGIIGKRKG